MSINRDNKDYSTSDNRRNTNHQSRCIGRVRFFDAIKQFGFIDTNHHGDGGMSADFFSRELFFRTRDIIGGVPGQGDWVTFTISKSSGARRDNARQVQKVQCCYRDLNLAMHYVDPDSIINVENKGGFSECYDVKRSVVDVFIENTEGCQQLLDYAIDKLSKRDGSKWRHAITGLFCSDDVVSILSDPESRGLRVKSPVGLEQVLLSICYYKILETSQNEGGSSSNNSSLDRSLSAIGPCLVRLSSRSINDLADMICMLFADDVERACSCLVYINKNLSGSSRINWSELNANAEQRLCLFNKGIEASVLFHETVIEYWNGLVLPHEKKSGGLDNPFSCLHSPCYNEILQYVLSTGKASDKLLFDLFCFTHNAICLTNIKNREFFVEELPLFAEVPLFSFLLWGCSSLAEDVRVLALRSIGVEKIYRCLKRMMPNKTIPFFLEFLPDDMIVDAYAIINEISVEKREEETVTDVSRFTWGEGTRDEYRIDRYIYLDTTYSCVGLMKREHAVLVDASSLNVNSAIQKEVDSCLQKQMKTSVLMMMDSRHKCPILVRLHIEKTKDWSEKGSEYQEVLHSENMRTSIQIGHTTYTM